MIVEDHDSSKRLFVTVSVLLVFDCSKFKYRGQKWFQKSPFYLFLITCSLDFSYICIQQKVDIRTCNALILELEYLSLFNNVGLY